MERRGDYGYDVPDGLLIFAALGAASVVAAIVSRWNQRGPVAALTFYGAFFLANAFSFLYATRRNEIETGDMRALPFPDASFHVVVSSLAIDNIRCDGLETLKAHQRGHPRSGNLAGGSEPSPYRGLPVGAHRCFSPMFPRGPYWIGKRRRVRHLSRTPSLSTSVCSLARSTRSPHRHQR